MLQLVPQLAYPGAWTQQRGHFYSKFSILRFSETAQFTIEGIWKALLDNGKVTDLGLYYYLEYGLFDDLTLITSLPFKRTSYSCAIESCNTSSSGLGDIYFGFRYRLAQESWVLSLQSGLKLPMGYETDVGKLDSAPPLGDGQLIKKTADLKKTLLTGRLAMISGS